MQPATTPERMFRVGALASLSAGLVAGIGARIIMRIVALTSHMPPSFSFAGTITIVFTGIFLGFAAGFVILFFTMAASSSPRVRKYLPGPIWRGLITSLLLLLAGFPIFVGADAADLALGIPLLNKLMFGALIIIYGLTLGVATKAFDHYLPREPASVQADIPAPNPLEE